MDLPEHKLQAEKNPDIAKAIQNAAKLKKAKERLEQVTGGNMRKEIHSSVNQPLDFRMERLNSERQETSAFDEVKLGVEQDEEEDGNAAVDKDSDLDDDDDDGVETEENNNIEEVCYNSRGTVTHGVADSKTGIRCDGSSNIHEASSGDEQCQTDITDLDTKVENDTLHLVHA